MFIAKKKVLSLLENVKELQEEVTLQSLRTEDQDWISLSDPQGGVKDANFTDYLTNHQTCYEAFMTNPLCRRFVKYVTYFCVGKGMAPVAEEPDVQEVLDGFWKHDDNNLGTMAKQVSDELSAYGELFIRYFYDEYLGFTRIGTIDPSEIVYVETDPENIKKKIRYHRRYRVPRIISYDPDGYPSIEYDIENEVIEAVREDGLLNVQHVPINNVSNAVRGVSDLLPVVKWAARYSDWLQDRYVLNKIRGLFHYDVTITGGNKKSVAAYLENLKNKKVGSSTEDTDSSIAEASTSWRIKPGSIRVHSDKVKWDCIQPSIGADDAKEDGESLLGMFCAGSGIPKHWLGNTGDANLATAKAMDLPTLQQFIDRQEYLGDALGIMLKQVILCARTYGDLPNPAEGKDDFNDGFEVIFPSIEPKQLEAIATAFKIMVEALELAVRSGRISEDTANKILQQYDENIQDWEGEGGEKEKIANEKAENPEVQMRLPVGA
jgi:hypothetical protein